MNLSEAVNRVIDLGRKIRAYYDSELPKYFTKYPLVSPGEEEPPPPPEEKELQDFLASLPEDMVYQLILIQHLGRGKFSTDDLASNYEARKETFGDPKEVASEMMWGKAVLGDQLADGLEELQKHKINVDKMPLKKAKVARRK